MKLLWNCPTDRVRTHSASKLLSALLTAIRRPSTAYLMSLLVHTFTGVLGEVLQKGMRSPCLSTRTARLTSLSTPGSAEASWKVLPCSTLMEEEEELEEEKE